MSTVGVLVAGGATAAEWPQFRGPRSDGVADVSAAPLVWSESENVSWKTSLPGRGWSSPVVSDGLIWLTAAIEEFPSAEEQHAILEAAGTDPKQLKARQVATRIRLLALAVDLASGKLRHTIDLLSIDEPDAIHSLNSYASPTPVLDGDRLYCHFGTFGTVCLNTAGQSIVWTRRLEHDHSVGPGSSPVIYGDLLVMICDGIDRQYVAALDKATGATVWMVDRPPMDAADGERKKAYSTPLAVTDSLGREQLICLASQWIVSHDPATGAELWRLRHGNGYSVVPQPVVADGLVYISTGFAPAELVAARIDGSGDVTDTHVAWREKRNIPTKPSPVASDGKLFFIDDAGIATCLEAASGATLWKERIGGNYSASPLLADGKIYLASHEGKVTVIAASGEYEELAENTLDGQIMASPIAVDDCLLVRTDRALYRIDARPQPRRLSSTSALAP